jgi:diguanylate cyclase (GGDEF)-like protein/PAS domain S-box-containing protein
MTSPSESNVTLLADLGALRGIIDAVPHPIFVKDAEHRFLIVNQTMCDFMGRSYYDLIGRTDRDFVPKEQADIFHAKDRSVLDSGVSNENEEFFTDGEGNRRTIIARKKRLILPNGTRLVVGCITDISEYRGAEALIRYNAEHDHLTGVANRALFRDRLNEAVAAVENDGVGAALLLVDLDGFKSVNDAQGHGVGDELLIRTAGILSSLVGLGDTVARLGGDEFAIVQRNGEQPAAAIVLAGAAIKQLSKPMFLGVAQAHVSASIGIADVNPEDAGRDTLIRHADLALYAAKKDGHNTWRLFEPAMEASHLQNRFLEDDLRLAVARQQFSLVFQPFADAQNLEVLGFETLLRWNHPSRGEVDPGLFVPVAERTGAIAALGEWALRAACAEAGQWRKPLRLSINVSPVQFAQVDLPTLVRSVVRETGIDPGRIDLEITETAVIKDVAGAARIFGTLRGLGVHVVLDDFGAGYSSLNILKSLPFDKIKIDRSLLHDVGRTKQADAIIGAILQLARTLDLRVTVEGVETEEQLAVLRREHCDELQGFLIGRPASIAAYDSVVAGERVQKRA